MNDEELHEQGFSVDKVLVSLTVKTKKKQTDALERNPRVLQKHQNQPDNGPLLYSGPLIHELILKITNCKSNDSSFLVREPHF